MPEPGQAEVLAWMARTGQGATDAARHFFPGAPPRDHKRLAAKYRQWKNRHGLPTDSAPAPSKQASTSTTVTAMQLQPGVAKMKPVERLEWLIERAAAGVEYSCATGDVRALSSVSKVLAELGQLLDKARAAEARASGLDRGLKDITERLNTMQDLLRRAQHARERSL